MRTLKKSSLRKESAVDKKEQKKATNKRLTKIIKLTIKLKKTKNPTIL